MKYLSILLNWRIDVITILAALTLAFAVSDSDDIVLFFLSKVIAVVLGYYTHTLAKRWDGNMPELKVFSIDEEDITF